MNEINNINIPKKGMNRDVHPINLEDMEYTTAFNANLEDETGSGYPMIQNEHSNILCSKFKEGYIVIGFKSDINENKTYFFLTNPTTGFSEIGYIENTINIQFTTDDEVDCGCDYVRKLGDRLEDINQTQTCVYREIIHDRCNGCLNFSINYPIREGNIILKDEKTGKKLYWTDNYNPPRCLDLGNLDYYKRIRDKNCGDKDKNEVELEKELSTCINCDRLRIFKKYSKPCIQPASIEYGGSLRAGTYEFLIAYCDKQGHEMTQYFSITNPISIFDETQRILTQPTLAYTTNFGIRLEVSDLDINFGYYKVVVIQRAEVDSSTSYLIEGIHSISDKIIYYYSDVDKQRISFKSLLAVKPTYLRSGILTASNGYLLHADLTAEKEYNLQPVMNLFGAFLRWQTCITKENIYLDGVNVSKHKGYMRDEVYPFSIRFYTKDGFETSNYILSNRPATNEELQDVSTISKEYKSLLENSPVCGGTTRQKVWQFYNTATVLQRKSSRIDHLTDKELLCNPIPYETGKFAYWESIEKFPLNDELYNSRKLKISKDRFKGYQEVLDEFMTYFGEGIDKEGNILLHKHTNFSCMPIRHYKFPDNRVSSFILNHKTIHESIFEESYILPIGVTFDMNILNIFLDIAVDNQLITKEQRNQLDKFEIFRGDRALNKGVVAKGLSYDMYEYNEKGKNSNEVQKVLYSNYPYNDLRQDRLNYTNESRKEFIPHPHGGMGNNRYTFHSPDIHFYKPTIPTEVNIEGYQAGMSRGQFAQVKGHSKWVILSRKAYDIATTLAISAAVFDLAAKYGDLQVKTAMTGNLLIKGVYKGKVGEATNKKYTFDAGISSNFRNLISSRPKTHEYTGKEEDNYDNYGSKAEFVKRDLFDDLPTGGKFGMGLEGDGKGLEWKEKRNNEDRLTKAEKILILTGMISNVSSKIGESRYQWLKNFKENGQPNNFAYYYSSVGHYNKLITKSFKESIDNNIRGIVYKKYLDNGRFRHVEKIDNNKQVDIFINNHNRESSLYLSFGKSILYYPNLGVIDESRFCCSEKGIGGLVALDKGGSSNAQTLTYQNRTEEVSTPIVSPYISLKNYLPGQYGNVDSIKWLATGFCGDMSKKNLDKTIYGGDIFISRFTLKRKFPLFLKDATSLSDLIPFNYYPVSNLPHPRFYVDYDVSESHNLGKIKNSFLDTLLMMISGGIVSQTVSQFRSYYNMDNSELSNDERTSLYISPPHKFYLYYYGIPSFLVESEINCNYRYGKREPVDQFYPLSGDYIDWTQEKTGVSIRRDNTYYYNNTYSKSVTQTPTRVLPSTFDSKLFNSIYDSPNGVIYSVQDTSEQDLTDPWLIYRPLDSYLFPTSYGKLIDLRGIESSQVLGRFETQLILFNAIDYLKERITPENQTLGTGGMFSTRPLEFNRTDLGYAGTQHKSMVSCEYGHYIVDANRGQIFNVGPGGRGLTEITGGMRNWFKQHLPFKILRGKIENLSSLDLDNPFKGIGITTGWDSRFKRVFITKKDYVVKPEYVGKLEYRDKDIFIRNTNTKVDFTDSKVFDDASFTIAYNPLMKSWVSYYSFKPNYYISHHDHFKTGINFSRDSKEFGLWSHLVTNQSYQVFYGKRYGWLIELPVKEKYYNSQLNSIQYWLDSKRYHNNHDFSTNNKVGFNKLWIYNNTNNSGLLNLVTTDKNNLYQQTQYPKRVDDGMEILATENERKWTINDFYNQTRDELNNQPIWVYDHNAIDKVLNPHALRYTNIWKDRLRGDWFLIRFAQDYESRYKQIFKFLFTKELPNI